MRTQVSSTEGKPAAAARVVAVHENLVTIEVHTPIRKNEVAYVHVGDARLMAEVLRVRGREADLQVFEETHGVAIGNAVELSGELLSATLGPGLLGQVYDGLQNPLSVLANRFGFFLQRGVYEAALDDGKKWAFTPVAAIGARVPPGGTLGTVQEGRFTHKIMVPFDIAEPVTVTWIQQGGFTVDTVVARVAASDGAERDITLAQRAPLRRPLPERLLQRGFAQRLYPDEPLTTTIRMIDTFFPIARGGTACIPGPFGAGKTVLQSLIARYAQADVVIIVACGERAGEVVETLTEFPQLRDPQGGGSLMDRTVIIANTSSMPVAARESSIYLGITLAEYYRQMGYNALVIADSTSRWAQALRETSGSMEEIPGEEAFPAYLDSTIKSVYERAGVIRGADGVAGSLTLIGTVSPAGGNFDEPVTQATLGTVKTFLGLSAERAYRRCYPAIDPLISWSRYLTQLQPWLEREFGIDWVPRVQQLVALLKSGESVRQMMEVTGEEGVTLEDFVTFQKANLVDMVYLQQDAFDVVDVTTPPSRQRVSLDLLGDLVRRDYNFADKEAAREYFTQLTSLFRNFNYSVVDTEEYVCYREEMQALAQRYG